MKRSAVLPASFSALHLASYFDLAPLAQNLLSRKRWMNHFTLVYKRASDGKTALHWAAEKGHAAMILLLIKEGAHVNVENGHGETSLHAATQNENETTVRLLIENRADISAKEENKETSLYDGVPYEREAIMRLLIQTG